MYRISKFYFTYPTSRAINAAPMILRSPSAGHDACGVGFIAHLRGKAGHDIVSYGLAALRRLTHRGADAAFGAVDGCGVLTAVPWTLLGQAMAGRLPHTRTPAVAMLFVDAADQHPATTIVERELRAA